MLCSPDQTVISSFSSLTSFLLLATSTRVLWPARTTNFRYPIIITVGHVSDTHQIMQEENVRRGSVQSSNVSSMTTRHCALTASAIKNSTFFTCSCYHDTKQNDSDWILRNISRARLWVEQRAGQRRHRVIHMTISLYSRTLIGTRESGVCAYYCVHVPQWKKG